MLLCSASFAQDKLAFRIISVDGNVTLDGGAVTIGQQVTTASSGKLVIHERSQASVLLPWGVITRLGPGENDVATLGDAKRWLAAQGAVFDGGPLIQPGGNEKNYLLGDDVSLLWLGSINKSLKMRVMSEYADIYLDTVIQRRVDIKNFSRFFKEKELIIVEISSGKKNYENISISPIGDEQRKRLQQELAQIENHPYKKVLTIAMLEAHELNLDAVVHVLQVGKLPEDTPSDLKQYISMRSQGWLIK